MNLYNIKDHSEQVGFQQAVKQGLGRGQGLFFPSMITPLANIDELLALNLVDRSTEVLSHLIGDELSKEVIHGIVSKAFTFDAPVKKVTDKINALELFHGPTIEGIVLIDHHHAPLDTNQSQFIAWMTRIKISYNHF